MASNSFGEILRMTSFGESHGSGLGVVIDGVPAGLPLVVSDSGSDPVDLLIEYQDETGQWLPARPAGIAPGLPTPSASLQGVPTDDTGVPVTFVWDSEFDLAGFEGGAEAAQTIMALETLERASTITRSSKATK